MMYYVAPQCSYLTAAALLADATQRRECEAVLARGGQYYEGPAKRETIRAAVAYLKARGDRRSQRGTAEAARRGPAAGRILAAAKERNATRERDARQRWVERVGSKKLGLSTVRRTFRRPEFQQRFLGRRPVTNEAIRLIARAVGPVGEQAERDLDEIRTSYRFEGKKSRRHWYEETFLHRVEVLPDWSAALVTLRTAKSWGRGGGENGYEKQGGVSFACWLIVRDATSGECHVLRVPPKFGNESTQFFGRFRAPKDRIHAAVAWTFGLEPREYRPTREA